MGKCAVPSCKGKPNFYFPKNEKLRILWEKSISVDFQASKSSRLCSKHFEKDLIIEKKEGFYTGVTSSKKFLKPNAVPTLMLELGVQKSRRSQKIRNALFEDDYNDSSLSLSLSLVNDPMDISENSANSSIESPVKNCISLSSSSSSSNKNNEITETQRKTELQRSPIVPEILIDQHYEEPFTSCTVQDYPTILDTSSVLDDDYSNIYVQTEEEVCSMPDSSSTQWPAPESNNADYIESNDAGFSKLKNKNASNVKKKCFSSVGIQVGRGPLSVKSISHRDDVIHYYTGLGTYAKFQFVYGTLSDYVNDIKYVKGQVNFVEPEDMFLLVLIKLRRNIPDFGLSFYFGISEAVVRNIFTTWIHFIHQLWSSIDTWPSREVVDFYMPEGFKKLYSSTRVIVDATEIPIDKPSNPIAQQAIFSTYKNRNTVKVLVGGSPDGILCYNSAAYGGSTSDRQIVERSDLVKKCEKGDSVMADRGFNVQDIFESQGVTVNIPHFLKGKQLPSVTVLSDRKLASKRVHIERLIGLTKTYKILREPLNSSYTRLATNIFSICLMLCNFRESVVSSVA